MSDHPPPAPGWIRGEDGHWKPPPFTTTGPLPTGPLVPPAPPATWPSPDAPPAGWAPGMPGWGPPPPPPPPSPSSSTGRTFAIVLGGVAVAGVAFVGLLIGAVTFLGTSSESRVTPGDTGSATTDGADPSGPTTPATPPDTGPPPGADTTLPPPTATEPVPEAPSVAQATADYAAVRLIAGGEWVVTSGEALPTYYEADGFCVPQGWLTGVTDRFRTTYGRPASSSTEALTLSITAYASPEDAQAELERARSDMYRGCEAQERVSETAVGATQASVTALADDPLAPGVAYQIDLIAADPVTEFEFTLVVGSQRAHLDFCGCADLGLEGQQAAARVVAAAMAEAQGLPPLG